MLPYSIFFSFCLEILILICLFIIVSCGSQGNCPRNFSIKNQSQWKFTNSKLENHQGYLKSNDTINLSIQNPVRNRQEFLRSHDLQFTIETITFQEVFCHNERLGGNDEVCETYYVYWGIHKY